MIDRTIHCDAVLTAEGWLSPARIRIDSNGCIEDVSRCAEKRAADMYAGHILPGMPNVHSHAFQRQMAGLTETGAHQADDFWSWRDAMYRLAGRITPEQYQAIAACLQVEMLEAGYTSCAEFHYVHHQPGGQEFENLAEMSARLIAAADTSGMALTLLPVLYCRSGFSSNTVTDRQRRFFNTPERYLALLTACKDLVAGHPVHRLGLAAHSLRAVAYAQLSEVLAAPEVQACPVHIHVAEQPAEVAECEQALGARPVSWLLQNFPVDRRWCLVHATHMNEEELARAASSGAVAGLCPTTEADLGDGLFPAESWIAAGGRLGVGSDSNLRVSVTEELRLLENGCRLRTLRRNVLADDGASCGRSLYQRAAAGGAQAIGQPVGRVERGCRADLVELDCGHLLLAGRSADAVLDTWLFAGDASMVKTVWVRGERRVVEGRHINRSEIEAPFRKAMKELGTGDSSSP